MSDVTCPYCKTEQEICHDDGYGYDDGEYFEQECVECDREFKFTTSITFSYQIFCHPEDHVMTGQGGNHPRLYCCENCDFFELR